MKNKPAVFVDVECLSPTDIDRLGYWLKERSIKVRGTFINNNLCLEIPAEDELALRLAFDLDEK